MRVLRPAASGTCAATGTTPSAASRPCDGYGAELVTLEEDFAIPIPPELGTLGVLTEPASVLAKAWEQIDRISTRACSVHERALITGAGPIGLLGRADGRPARARAPCARPRHRGASSRRLVRALGASYHTGARSRWPRGDPAGHRGRVHGRGRARGRRHAAHAPGRIVCLDRRGPVAHASASTWERSTTSSCSRTTSCSAR